MAKVLSIKKTIKEADEAEEKEDISLAIKDHEEAIKANPLFEKTYDRLMILYRKDKDYKNELRIINTGIKSFEDFYRSRKTDSKKIAQISKKLNRSFGFTDKKGNAVYEPEPIARWKKRKVIVEKRIKK
jgi:hypothetical protein